MSKAIEAVARALSQRSNFALAGDWDAQVEHDQRMMDNAQAAITAYLAAMKAEGFVMVPVEATPKMCDAAFLAGHKWGDERNPAIAYRAMIAAAIARASE